MTPSEITVIAASGAVDQIIGCLFISAASTGLMMVFHWRKIRQIERQQQRRQIRRELMRRIRLRQLSN